MERAIFSAEQDVVEWPDLPLQPANCAQAANHILRLTRGGQSAPDPRRPARADSTPDWEAAVFVATDANDAWVLSVMVYHWRTSKLFRPVREARNDVHAYRVTEAARCLRGLLTERRGGHARDDAPIRTVRHLILQRGDRLATLLGDFETATNEHFRA